MKPSPRPAAAAADRRAHQMLSSTAATSTTMSKPYRMAATGRWKLAAGGRLGRGLAPWAVTPGGRAGPGLLAASTRRCRLSIMATATATMPAPSTKMSTPRSLTATALTGAPPGPRRARAVGTAPAQS